MINRTIKEFGRLDILVNNAGIIAWRKLAKVTREEWDRIIQINLTAVFNCTKSVMAPMMEEGFGKIILNASVYAFNGPVGSVAYSTAKSALIGFTKVLGKEAGPYGINVNALAPGYISTDMSKDITEEEKETIIENIPLRRAGLPADFANAAIFLASEEASYISGQVIIIDGGWKL